MWVYNIANNMHQLQGDEGNTLSRIVSGRKITAKSDPEEGSSTEARKKEPSSVEECKKRSAEEKIGDAAKKKQGRLRAMRFKDEARVRISRRIPTIFTTDDGMPGLAEPAFEHPDQRNLWAIFASIDTLSSQTVEEVEDLSKPIKSHAQHCCCEHNDRIFRNPERQETRLYH